MCQDLSLSHVPYIRVFIKFAFLLSGYVVLQFQQHGNDETNVSCIQLCLKS